MHRRTKIDTFFFGMIQIQINANIDKPRAQRFA
jgi:hypothetical protein